MPDMIKNDQHYETTKYWVEKFAHTLDSLRRRSEDSLKDLHPLLAKAQEDAAASVLQEFEGPNVRVRILESRTVPYGETQQLPTSCRSFSSKRGLPKD